MIESQIIVGTLRRQCRVRLAESAPGTPGTRVTLRISQPVELRLEQAPLAGSHSAGGGT
jgi:hypothetical protein